MAHRQPLGADEPVPAGYEVSNKGEDSSKWWLQHVSGKAAEGASKGGQLHPGYYVPVDEMRELEYEVVPDTANAGK